MKRLKNLKKYHCRDDVGIVPNELSAWLKVAEHAAREAGKFLIQARTSEAIVTADLERDVKLAADRGSEERIIRVLHERTSFAIFSEESGMVEGTDLSQGLQWIVDPLDGSLNYLQDIPLFCVSIGLWREQEPLLGAVYDFNHDEMFTGIMGEGAWLNGLPIHVSNTARLDQAVLCTGFPVDTDFSPEALGNYVEQVRAYKKVRLLGSAALSLCYVAAGRADAYFERDIKLWDVAAGLAIVRGARGQIVRGVSQKPHALNIYASNPSLSDPCL